MPNDVCTWTYAKVGLEALCPSRTPLRPGWKPLPYFLLTPAGKNS